MVGTFSATHFAGFFFFNPEIIDRDDVTHRYDGTHTSVIRRVKFTRAVENENETIFAIFWRQKTNFLLHITDLKLVLTILKCAHNFGAQGKRLLYLLIYPTPVQLRHRELRPDVQDLGHEDGRGELDAGRTRGRRVHRVVGRPGKASFVRTD